MAYHGSILLCIQNPGLSSTCMENMIYWQLDENHWEANITLNSIQAIEMELQVQINNNHCHGNFTVSTSLAFARQTDESAGTKVLSVWKQFWQLGGDGFFNRDGGGCSMVFLCSCYLILTVGRLRWWWWVFLPQAPPSSHTGPHVKLATSDTKFGKYVSSPFIS